MKYAFVALALAAAARAQSRSDIPSCALDCLDEAITSKTSCTTTDYTCVCKNFDSIQGSATSCVIKACGADVAVSKFSPHSPLPLGFISRWCFHLYDAN